NDSRWTSSRKLLESRESPTSATFGWACWNRTANSPSSRRTNHSRGTNRAADRHPDEVPTSTTSQVFALPGFRVPKQNERRLVWPLAGPTDLEKERGRHAGDPVGDRGLVRPRTPPHGRALRAGSRRGTTACPQRTAGPPPCQ